MTSKQPHSDQKYIDALISWNKPQSQQLIKEIYQINFPIIRQMILQNSGNQQDAEDHFVEVLCKMRSIVMRRLVPATYSFKNYFYGIARNMWMNKLNKGSRGGVTFIDPKGYENIGDDADLQIKRLETKENCIQFIKDNKDKLGERCQKFINLWLEGVSIKKRAELLEVTENYANVNTSKCKNKLRAKVKKDPKFKQECFN